MAQPKEQHWLPLKAYEHTLGLQLKTLRGRGVLEREGEGGRVEFEFASVWERCAALIAKRLPSFSGMVTEAEIEALKADKLREEIRRLALDNDTREGKLVAADEVEIVYGRAMRAISDELDGMVVAVKIAHPDVPQSVLAVVADKLAEARRKAARIDFGNLLDGVERSCTCGQELPARPRD